MVSVNARTALRTSDASQAGIYTLALTNNTGGAPLPSGTAGIGVVKVSKAGRVRFSALLSNGQILTQGSQLSDDGSWLLSAKSGRDNALVGGAVTFVDQPGSDLQGELSWTRPERLKGNRVVQSSASTSLLIAGSTYTASQGIRTQEGRPAGWRLYIEGVDHSVSCNVALLQQGQLRTTPIEGGRASVRFVKPLGFVAGNYVKDGERVRRSLLGVLFQKTGEVVGLADRPGRGGSFSMTPSSEAAGSGGSAGAVKEGSGTVVISDLGSGTEIVGGGIPSGPIGSIQLGDSNGTTAGE